MEELREKVASGKSGNSFLYYCLLACSSLSALFLAPLRISVPLKKRKTVDRAHDKSNLDSGGLNILRPCSNSDASNLVAIQK